MMVTLMYWQWLLAGFMLIIAELVMPGAFLLWIGVATFLMAGLILIYPEISLSLQLVIFGLIAPVVMLAGRRLFRNFSLQTGPSVLNRRGHQLIGQTIVLDVPILHNHAHVTVGDSKWRVQGPDLPAGDTVKVIAIEGNMLIVCQDSA
jgi:membrane protein implicated in regulation of membrane protease activity